jgi:tetratricopeptide (TPR) repeat protein
MTINIKCMLIIIALALVSSHALAADSAPTTPASDNLASARARIADKNWPAAIADLKRVNDTGSADWNNLMGYSLRKSGSANYVAAEKFYDEALRIDPKHRGALEYSGQLYLSMGNLPKAEQRLAALDQLCRMPCEEYTDLKNAVASYKAEGKK